ncbi:MAG: rRNA maturation RNase YbeY [Bacteroidales bacterium]|nr:rRNA maturation RNase YbeY [Bacteroidales bacterium]
MNEKAIQFFTEDIQYQIKGKGILRRGIVQLIEEKSYRLGTVNIIICSDTFLKGYNKKYLNHDYYTDVVAFDLSENPEEIRGEVYISLDRVRENARIFRDTVPKELARVMIHGILHLTGMDDSTEKQREGMRKEEDRFLSTLFKA